ncbi:gas vesicle protein GvpU [Halobacillus salinarum]|uniref:Gas vesicle protein GvpU n=1 Tax=Halobacillus salinarum TaxID=2932257 RepID=A0ABY4EJB4_9BACI|nr:gas vesicle accessory protein GvpU [Halobacillus salinarum]UOQ44142.1 gas vesicle protein GvpU [Halobacillus salinarum]
MDDLLLTFVKAANQHDFSLDITLNINGALISGTTISAQRYLESLSNVFEEGNEVSQAIGEKLSASSQSAKENGEDTAAFIHLKNAQVYNGDSQPTPSDSEFHWRGKIEEVDGFFLGKISVDDK